jgi:cellulose synthase A
MEANAGMVAGSYKRNELVRIRHDSDSSVSALAIANFDVLFNCFSVF